MASNLVINLLEFQTNKTKIISELQRCKWYPLYLSFVQEDTKKNTDFWKDIKKVLASKEDIFFLQFQLVLLLYAAKLWKKKVTYNCLQLKQYKPKKKIGFMFNINGARTKVNFMNVQFYWSLQHFARKEQGLQELCGLIQQGTGIIPAMYAALRLVHKQEMYLVNSILLILGTLNKFWSLVQIKNCQSCLRPKLPQYEFEASQEELIQFMMDSKLVLDWEPATVHSFLLGTDKTPLKQNSKFYFTQTKFDSILHFMYKSKFIVRPLYLLATLTELTNKISEEYTQLNSQPALLEDMKYEFHFYFVEEYLSQGYELNIPLECSQMAGKDWESIIPSSVQIVLPKDGMLCRFAFQPEGQQQYIELNFEQTPLSIQWKWKTEAKSKITTTMRLAKTILEWRKLSKVLVYTDKCELYFANPVYKMYELKYSTEPWESGYDVILYCVLNSLKQNHFFFRRRARLKAVIGSCVAERFLDLAPELNTHPVS